jgi:hypothetical protein
MKIPSVKPMKSRIASKSPKRPSLFLGQKVIGELRILMRLASPLKASTAQNGHPSTTSSY